MKTVAIIQARMGSTRLPGKVLEKIGTVPAISVLIQRLSCAKRLDQIVVATSTSPNNAPLVAHLKSENIAVFSGSEEDVLDRYYQTALHFQADAIDCITGDCPLVDPDLVDLVIQKFEQEEADYATNTNPSTYPDGLDVEVFTMQALSEAWKSAKTRHEREHVTPLHPGVRHFSPNQPAI